MSRPWMPWYVADFVADTLHLSAAQTGSYMLLIGHYWQHGELPGDDAALARVARMTPAEWRKAKPAIAAFFHDGWHHKRIDAELARASDISSKRAASAKQKHSNSSANAEQLDTHTRASSPSQRKEDAPDGALGDPEKELFEKGKQVLGKNSGGLIAELLKAKNKNVALARAAIETASTKQNPREYIGAISRGPKDGEFKLMSGIEGVV